MTRYRIVNEQLDSKSPYTLIAKDLCKTFETGKGRRNRGEDTKVHALKGVNLSIKRGEYFSIVGPSGSGKTTLFNMLGGLDEPTSGTVYLDDLALNDYDQYQLAWIRSHMIGFVFQTYNLLPIMTAYENVAFAMQMAGYGKNEIEERVKYVMKQVGLEERMKHKPKELSGGQQQRVAIARALVNKPRIILADEPTGNLDLRTGKEIIALLKQLNTETGVTVVSATHDIKMLDVSDRIAYMRDGQIERIAERKDIDIIVGELEGKQT